MYKTKLIGFTLLLWLFLGVGAYAYARDDTSSTATEQLRPVTSSRMKGVDWVHLCTSQYPEILWLADENVRKTEEGKDSLQGAYSEQLFGKKFIEFDRTIMTLHCLGLILDGSDKAYQEFTQAQPEDAKLSRKSFHKLHIQGASLLRSMPQMSELEVIQAMEASLVLGDIGKSEKAREIFKPYGAKAPDHDDFHEEVMQILLKHPELCPTFNRLSSAAKRLLSEVDLIHYGHVTHMEGGPRMFSKLKQSHLPNSSPGSLLFDFFVHTCDVAGALGHVNNQSSLVYTESSHLAMQGVLESCQVLGHPHKTEIDAYNAYLAIRAGWLGLNADDRTDRALTRMGAMLRLFTPEEGSILKQAVLKLSPEIQTQIIEQLDIRQGEELMRTPTYMPAVLVNLANNPDLGSSKEERISQAVILGLPFIARVLKTHKQHLASLEADPAIPLNFNQAAGVAKTNPSALNGQYTIDSEGNVRAVLKAL
ncbi:MAG: hypothetical protein A3D96_00715 [Chlamydiae bacterium RIFCSPHIGHO2_12_FULL_44_59]|nr:MAG: hypothetical protein A2796_00160 [Chlamydiae bacterium RIFCSPHIGHO2_01_FULL_44_39]OGN58463.1 MAG: hypothetical protein A3C42_03385 [Chlamydiae bacterium RIFCSPHIGHO2_02_FULL_45_9]OGN59969.1 MAG: hypothetical protein A3D96_00715 [Chlamydiae bacterium RIFCSPHIGHO2_12_FULL_44_59]OGN66184.1 MAG: hypothetical protein A2978_06040 [Chlamydiae bacterium RIFCSPLOWO2_01_FULL_44_52]OGN69088.1 MAG: hypothetical protein A3I67_07525 [Chlamydiae bacterium RIFCSPLOWO2_02_FULL_45_22]OGN69890.1 MAG: hyp